jgi:hypothetical protein
MDMRYHWLTYRVLQKQFNMLWRPGRENIGDYQTKHHSAQYPKDMRGLILHKANILQVLQWCIKLPPLPQLHSRTRTYAQTCQSTQRATQLRGVLVCAYYVSI